MYIDQNKKIVTQIKRMLCISTSEWMLHTPFASGKHLFLRNQVFSYFYITNGKKKEL